MDFNQNVYLYVYVYKIGTMTVALGPFNTGGGAEIHIASTLNSN